MKKISSIILILLMILTFITSIVNAKTEEKNKKVNVYLFTRQKCEACDEALNYLYNLQKENKDLFNIYKLEVWNKNEKILNNDARNLMIDVYDYYNDGIDKVGTPTIVIGDYFNIGCPNEHEILYDAIKEESENEDYIDHVKLFAKIKNIDIKEFKYVKKISYFDITIISMCIIIIIGLIVIIIKRNHK